MKNSICKKVGSLLFLYIENKLDDEDRFYVEKHFQTCNDCYQKYLEMKEIVNNLHFEYEKLLNEFERIESNQIFNIREYENFYKNISPYIDDELCYEDCIKFRKYLLKSKSARTELANAYSLKNNIKQSISNFKNKVNINYSKKIIKKLQEENKYSFDNVYKRAAILIGFMISTLILISIYMGFSIFGESFAKSENKIEIIKTINFPQEDELIEFSFDKNQNALLTAK